MASPGVVCFDLDGTLLDPNGSIRRALDATLVDHGFSAFEAEADLIGMGLRDILLLRTQDDEKVEAMVHGFRRHYTQNTWRLARWYPGILDVVDTARAAGLMTAIVTTKGEAEAQQLLAELGVLDRFDTVVGDDDVRPLKPAPAPIMAACGRLGRRGPDACMIGDTPHDILAGRAAGAYTIGVLWGHATRDIFEDPQVRPDAIVEDAASLQEAILAWAP